jgi:hypothetical protein
MTSLKIAKYLLLSLIFKNIIKKNVHNLLAQQTVIATGAYREFV